GAMEITRLSPSAGGCRSWIGSWITGCLRAASSGIVCGSPGRRPWRVSPLPKRGPRAALHPPSAPRGAVVADAELPGAQGDKEEEKTGGGGRPGQRGREARQARVGEDRLGGEGGDAGGGGDEGGEEAEPGPADAPWVFG